MLKKNIYRDVLKKAWAVTSKNKVLWFFGLLVALLGNGGECQILINVVDKIGNSSNLNNTFSRLNFTEIFSSVYKFLAYNPIEFALALTAVCAILFLAGFFIWIVIVSQSALIDGINKAMGKKNLEFNEGITIGIKKFVPVLGINVLAKILIFLILFGGGIPLLFLTFKVDSIVGVFLYLLLFLVLIPFSIIISFIAKYATAYVVLKNKNFPSAVRDAFELFRNNWVISLEMAFILFLLNISVGLVALVAIALVYMPLAAVSFMYLLSGFIAGSWLTVIVMAFLAIGILGFIGAMLAAFQWASWIILFKKLTARETVFSKIERVIVGFPQWVREHM